MESRTWDVFDVTYKHVLCSVLQYRHWILQIFNVDFVDVIFELRVDKFSAAYSWEGKLLWLGSSLCDAVQFLRYQFSVEYN